MAPEDDSVRQQLRSITFRLEWSDDRGEKIRHGTGFFVTKGGLALTAFHCVPDNVREGREPAFTAKLGTGKDEILVKLRLALPNKEDREWQETYDLAVLQSDAPPPSLDPPPCFYLAKGGSQRNARWRSHPLWIFGFPAYKNCNEDMVNATIDASAPVTPAINRSSEERQDWLPEALAFTVHTLDVRFDPDGLSGGPVYDRDQKGIVGVLVGVQRRVYATEFVHVRERAGAAGEFLQEWGNTPTLTPPPPPPRRKWLLIAAIIAVLAGGVAWLMSRGSPFAPPEPLTAGLSVDVIRGVGETSQYREKLTATSRFSTGECVRFAITSPVAGYLYVSDQELSHRQVAGDPFLIFPTRRTNKGRNKVEPGTEIVYPSTEDDPPYVQPGGSIAGYSGELLTVMVFREPLRVELGDTPLKLDPQIVLGPRIGARLFEHPAGQAVALARIPVRVIPAKK